MRDALASGPAQAEAEAVGGEHGKAGRLGHRVLELGISLLEVVQGLRGLGLDLGLFAGLVLFAGMTIRKLPRGFSMISPPGCKNGVKTRFNSATAKKRAGITCSAKLSSRPCPTGRARPLPSLIGMKLAVERVVLFRLRRLRRLRRRVLLI